MPRTPAPECYDEIVEHTVPDPSGAFAPSREQVRESQHRGQAVHHPMSPTEHVLAMRIYQALRDDGRIDLTRIEIIVQDAFVFVSGTVPGPSTIARIEDVAGHVHGVDRVISELIVREPNPR
jgi:osmotically-inducible protein OsmY